MDLAEFLTARLDEDEAVAKGVTFRSLFEAVGHGVQSPGGPGNPPMPIADVIDAETAAHIARHDPARVLREVEAKRKLLEIHRPGLDPCDAHDDALRSVPCDTLRHLATVYSDHPDYDEAWKP